MNHLTDQQIDFIATVVERSKIASAEIKEDLVDHFCCAIEEQLARGKSFETAYDLAYHNITPDGFDEIERETIYLLTSKKISSMKRLLYVSGYMSLFLATISAVLKLLHLPGGSIGVLLTGLTIILLFLPSLFTYLYRREINKSAGSRAMYILGFMALTFFCMASLAHIFHWPGTISMLIAALSVTNFALLPIVLFKRYHKVA
jgi:hypothetical protein